MRVLIKGDGAAAYCCAHLLTKACCDVHLQITDRARVPAIMLSDAAVDLMRDVFERPDLFHTAPRIHKRVASWGNAEPAEVEHSAIVVSEQEILHELRPKASVSNDAPDAAITIYTSLPLPSTVVEKRFGSRTAWALPVHLKADVSSSCCWIEALEDGWLFLIPDGRGSAWLLAVGAQAEQLLAQSRIVSNRISGYDGRGPQFPAGPRVLSSLCGPDWLACGSAAMAFDPICGDGTAHAIREAILAAAVVRAMRDGGNREELFEHYQMRLLAGFQRHLRFCVGFYKTGFCAPWWRKETQALNEGLEWCARRIEQKPTFRFQLRGFELQPVGQ